MKFVFFGTPRFAEIVLQNLIDAGMLPTIVICNPDKPVGRKKIITPPPVKQLIANGKWPIEILQPENARTIGDTLLAISPDFGVVAAYAKIIPDEILQIPQLGVIGVHPSLLPKFRGASPIQSAILNGKTETGVTLYLMDKKVDHGPILIQESLSITQDDTYLTLEEKLATLGGKLLTKTIPDFMEEKITPTEQNHDSATFTKKFETKDAEVDLENDDPREIYQKIRALNPEPGVFTFSYPDSPGKRVKLLEAKIESKKLVLKKIQIEGKKSKTL